jgi:hypothetical protein
LQVEQDRAGIVLGQLAFDLPYQPLAFLDIGFGGLPFDQLVDLGIAVAGVVALCTADIVLV